MTDQTWNSLLRDQLGWHWTHQLRDRLDGLTDDEYFWEPVPGCWSVRPRGTGTAPVQAGSGAMTIDFAMPEPVPPPFATIAWRLGHVIVGVLAMRNAGHFGRTPTDYQSYPYASSTRSTPPGRRGSRPSANPTSPAPAERRRVRTTTFHWRRSCCTSTAR